MRQRPQRDAGLLQPTRRNRPSHRQRRLSAHRRPGPSGRLRTPLPHRTQQGDHRALQRQERAAQRNRIQAGEIRRTREGSRRRAGRRHAARHHRAPGSLGRRSERRRGGGDAQARSAGALQPHGDELQEADEPDGVSRRTAPHPTGEAAALQTQRHPRRRLVGTQGGGPENRSEGARLRGIPHHQKLHRRGEAPHAEAHRPHRDRPGLRLAGHGGAAGLHPADLRHQRRRGRHAGLPQHRSAGTPRGRG